MKNKYNICDNNIANSSYHPVGPKVTIWNASKQCVHVKCHILSLESKCLESFKNISCNRMEPKQCINTWQITGVKLGKRHADNSGSRHRLRNLALFFQPVILGHRNR